MEASRYVLVHGISRTRSVLAEWKRHPGRILKPWLIVSVATSAALLLAVWAVAGATSTFDFVSPRRPPLGVGDLRDVVSIFTSNLLVLALHAMACVAGFIAGSSLPAQAELRSGLSRRLHEHGGRIAIVFVVCATAFSLTVQALSLGHSVARVAGAVGAAPGLLLLGVLPHALPELTALFLPLAAWIIASRRSEWDSLLAATLVTVTIAIPVLILTALTEVFIAPHILRALIGYA